MNTRENNSNVPPGMHARIVARYYLTARQYLLLLNHNFLTCHVTEDFKRLFSTLLWIDPVVAVSFEVT